MKHTKTLHYSVQSGGDGSAYPHFYESAELAELDQEFPLYGEGWGESCTGSIIVESDSPITVRDKVTTLEEEIKEMQGELEEEYNKDCKWMTERLGALLKLKNEIEIRDTIEPKIEEAKKKLSGYYETVPKIRNEDGNKILRLLGEVKQDDSWYRRNEISGQIIKELLGE